MFAPPQATPAPLVDVFDHVRSVSVSLDVPRNLIEIVVSLHRKRLVSALVDVAHANLLAMFLPIADMGDGELLHKGTQFSVFFRPQNEMPVIWHEAIATDPHGAGFKGPSEITLERLVVRVLENRRI